MKKTWLAMIGYFSPLNFSNRAAACLIITFPLMYLSVRHAVNAILFLFVLLSILDWAKYRTYDLIKKNQISIWLAILGFSSLILSTAITQLIRGDFHIQSFDGPSRIFLAGVVFLYLLTHPISSIKLFELTLPAGLILLLVAMQYLGSASNFYNPRYATYFTDPNTLGSQTLILGLMCFFLVTEIRQNRFLTILKLMGGAIGLFISIYAGSRGAWIALLPLLILWIILTNQTDSYENKTSKKQLILKPAIILLFIGLGLTLSHLYVPAISLRILDASNDISKLLTNVDFNTSIGTRLAMWEISLFQLAPVGGFSGIGDMSSIAATVTQLQLDPIEYKEAIFNLSYAGPHSDFLENLLRMGYIGAIAYIIMIVIPCIIFWKNRLNNDLDRRLAAHAGLYFITGIFFCGLSNGMLVHKYTCSFYGLIIACLLADILRQSKTSHS
jgi:O-antigen ligase